ncbi:dihydroneopterin aldolase [Microbacterium sp. YY-01]|uniref:dihydroneopterin aldolase n=1 Tax=Microbacterium sp. YY-01 TaxID=3421634 RepID=UPI003D1697D6
MSAHDQITLTGLRVRGHHGVFDFEREQGQDFVVDVTLHVDARIAAHSDNLADTVDYGQLAESIAAIIEGEPVDLIETLAERIAMAALAPFGVHAVDVTVHKPQAPIARTFHDVSVTIHRQRENA